MKAKLETKKAVLWGTIVIILQMILSNLLYMNPIVSKINKQFEGHPSIKKGNGKSSFRSCGERCQSSWSKRNGRFWSLYAILDTSSLV